MWKKGRFIIISLGGQAERVLASNVTEKEESEAWEREQQNVGPQKSRVVESISGQRGSQSCVREELKSGRWT